MSSSEDTSKVHYGVTRDDNLGALVQDRGEFTPGPGGGPMSTLRNCMGAYFSDRGRLFQSDRGRHFSVIVDGVSV
jgi:hypothetical protein